MRISRRSSNCFALFCLSALLNFSLVSALGGERAGNDGSYFISPPASGPDDEGFNDYIYNIGSTLDLAWSTEWSSVSLELCEQLVETVSYYSIFQDQQVDSIQWLVSLEGTGFSLKDGHLGFYFQISNTSTGSTYTASFTSHYFNLHASNGTRATQSVVQEVISPSSPARRTTTTTLTPPLTYNDPIVGATSIPPQRSSSIITSTTPSITSTPQSTQNAGVAGLQTATSSSPQSQNTSSTQSGQTSNSNSGVDIGVGVGVGVGVFLILTAMFVAFFWFRRRRRHMPLPLEEANIEASNAPPTNNMEVRARYVEELPAADATHEMSEGHHQLQELSGYYAQELPADAQWGKYPYRQT